MAESPRRYQRALADGIFPVVFCFWTALVRVLVVGAGVGVGERNGRRRESGKAARICGRSARAGPMIVAVVVMVLVRAAVAVRLLLLKEERGASYADFDNFCGTVVCFAFDRV